MSDGPRYYCGSCQNDPSERCCHLREDKPRVEIMDCKCAEYDVKLRGHKS